MKNILPTIFYLLLFVVLLLSLPIGHTLASVQIPVLTYHYIRDYNFPKDPTGITLSVSPVVFDEQMHYLSAHGYTPITLDTMYGIFNHQAGNYSKPVVLTFDDGYIDFYTNAYPILKKYNFHAVSFVVTGFIGKPAYLSWGNISDMQSSGLISFEAHTVSHAYLPKLSTAQQLIEMQQSKQALQSHLGTTVNFIAYPFGASNWIVQNTARHAGFIGGLGTWSGYVQSNGINMPRIAIRNTVQSVSSRLP